MEDYGKTRYIPKAEREKQKKTAASLGLKKIGDTTVQEDNAATKGKIEVIKHMVRVENA